MQPSCTMGDTIWLSVIINNSKIKYSVSVLPIFLGPLPYLPKHKMAPPSPFPFSGNYLYKKCLNPLNPELNPIYYLLALLGAHHFLHVSRIRVKLLTLRRLMSYIYIYGAPILDVSRSHTTTHHSR